MPNNTNYSKEDNTIHSKIQSNTINFKETRRSQIAVNEFPERQHAFQKLSPVNNLTVKQEITECITAIT